VEMTDKSKGHTVTVVDDADSSTADNTTGEQVHARKQAEDQIYVPQ